MQTKIDTLLLNKYINLFLKLIKSKNQTLLSKYREENENKKIIYKKSRNNLQFEKWKKEDIGTGEILKKIISAINLENNENDFIRWNLKLDFEKKIYKIKDKKIIYDYEIFFLIFFMIKRQIKFFLRILLNILEKNILLLLICFS